MLRGSILLLALLASSAHAGGGVFVPPLEIEIGAAAISTREGPSVLARQWMVGLSWASGNRHPTPVDVSVGVISTHAEEPFDPAINATGGFLDVALRLRESERYRAWAGVRGELMGTEGVGILGAAARLSVERWLGVEATGPNGGVIGALAVTAWVEWGILERYDRSLAYTTAAGLGIRLPAILLR